MIEVRASLEWQEVCSSPQFLDIWEDWGPGGFVDVLYELKGRPRVIVCPGSFPFPAWEGFVTCDPHSLISGSAWFCLLDSVLFSSGTSFSLFSHLQSSPVSRLSIWLPWWTLRIELFQILTLRTQPGALNQPSLLSTLPPPLLRPSHFPSPILHPYRAPLSTQLSPM